MNNERFTSHNLHVMISMVKNHAFLYDAPTNTVLKINVNDAVHIANWQQDGCDKKSEIFIALLKLLGEETAPEPFHSNWKESGKLSKLTFIVSTRCNLACKYCYANEGKYDGYQPADMTIKDAQDFLDILVSQGVNDIENVMFFGGEPLINIETIDAICRKFSELHEKNSLKKIPQYFTISNLTIYSQKIKTILNKYDIHVTASMLCLS